MCFCGVKIENSCIIAIQIGNSLLARLTFIRRFKPMKFTKKLILGGIVFTRRPYRLISYNIILFFSFFVHFWNAFVGACIETETQNAFVQGREMCITAVCIITCYQAIYNIRAVYNLYSTVWISEIYSTHQMYFYLLTPPSLLQRNICTMRCWCWMADSTLSPSSGWFSW